MSLLDKNRAEMLKKLGESAKENAAKSAIELSGGLIPEQTVSSMDSLDPSTYNILITKYEDFFENNGTKTTTTLPTEILDIVKDLASKLDRSSMSVLSSIVMDWCISNKDTKYKDIMKKKSTASDFKKKYL